MDDTSPHLRGEIRASTSVEPHCIPFSSNEIEISTSSATIPNNKGCGPKRSHHDFVRVSDKDNNCDAFYSTDVAQLADYHRKPSAKVPEICPYGQCPSYVIDNDNVVRPILKRRRLSPRSASESDVEQSNSDDGIVRPEIESYTTCGSPIFKKSPRKSLKELGFIPDSKVAQDYDSVFDEEYTEPTAECMPTNERRPPCTFYKNNNARIFEEPYVLKLGSRPRSISTPSQYQRTFDENDSLNTSADRIEMDKHESYGNMTTCKRKLDFENQCQRSCGRGELSDVCTCAVMKAHFLQMAKFGYEHVRRSDTTPAGLEQFKSELTRTNEILRDSVDILREVKSICGCNQFSRTRLTS